MKEDAARKKALDIERKLRLRDTSMGIIYQEAAVSLINVLKEHKQITNFDELIAKSNVVV